MALKNSSQLLQILLYLLQFFGGKPSQPRGETVNIGLWNSLLGPLGATWPQVSYWCATFKFALILLGILYGLAGWVWPRKRG